MRNLRTILIVCGAVLAVTGFSWLGYTLYNKFQPPSESPFNAVPGNTALIIQLNKAGNLLEELNRSNLLWRALSRFPGINTVKNELHYVDSTSRKNGKINKIFQQYNILVSITLSGRNNFGALYLASVAGRDPESYILEFINEINAGKAILSETPYSTTRLHRIQSGGSREAFYFAVLKGVFMGSFHADLVKRAIDRLSLNTPMAASSGFRKVQATAGKKVDANIYINYRFFSLVLSKITREENLPDLLKFSNFADWSGLDLIIKKDELLFNGITVASDSNQQFLSLFTDQKPQKKEIASIIPEKALYFTAYGWSDPSRFCQRFQNRMQREENFTGEQNDVISLIDRYQLNVSEYFLPWMGNEGCLFVTEGQKSHGETGYTAFSTRDTLLAATSLFALADTLGIRYDSLQFKRHKIYRLALPAFIPALFGELFGKYDVNCFTFVKGYIVFASQPGDLEEVIDAVSDKATLARDRVFNDFEANLSDKSNVFSYFNTRNAIHALKGLLSQDLSDQLNPMMDTLRKFESVAFQYSNADGQFYSSFFLRYDPNLGKEGPLQWQATLDTTIVGRPRIIPVSTAGNQVVVVNDVANNLYVVTPQGHIAWKLHIMGKIMGEIHTVQLRGSDSLCLLFNTDTHLYLLHADGTFAEKFPMRFPLHATNGITVTDWDNNRDYRVTVAFQDNRVYCFTLDGVSVYGWKRPNLKEEVNDPVSGFTVGTKDYLLVSGVTGNTMILDRTGDLQIMPGPKFTHAPMSGFHVNKTNKKGPFITTGPDGKLIFIHENGKTSEVTLNLFSPEHRFFYEDITGNGQPEFIFSDRNTIYYYDRNYKMIYTYAFRREISNPPFLLHGSEGKVMIGYVVPETNEMFLFDHNGYRELESGIRGNTPFDVGYLENDAQLNLVVGAGKILKNYRLPKP
ncbi:MAG: DUF3352 domain-containing protein [Bacteroidetes bacterium]|nr:DUF3352 domain-containing protein [Bacteroidota bacterium]